jgi:non-homologous end joining protein Ku
LVDAYAGRFDAKLFHDDYRSRVEELAQRKASGQVIAFPATKRKGPTVVGLADALEKSLKSAKKKSA